MCKFIRCVIEFFVVGVVCLALILSWLDGCLVRFAVGLLSLVLFCGVDFLLQGLRFRCCWFGTMLLFCVSGFVLWCGSSIVWFVGWCDRLRGVWVWWVCVLGWHGNVG